MAFYKLNGILLNADYTVAFCQNGHVYRHEDDDIKLETVDFEEFLCINKQLKDFVSVNVCHVSSDSINHDFEPSLLAFVNTKYFRKIKNNDNHQTSISLGPHLEFLIEDSPESFTKRLQVLDGSSVKQQISKATKVVEDAGWVVIGLDYDHDKGLILKVECRDCGHTTTTSVSQFQRDSLVVTTNCRDCNILRILRGCRNLS